MVQLPNNLFQSYLGVLAWSWSFYLRHVIVIAGLGLLSSIGRAIQIGWPDKLSPLLASFLELVVETARLATLLYIIGDGSFVAGLSAIFSAWSKLSNGKAIFGSFCKILKTHWIGATLSIMAFAIFAWLVNTAIGWIAESDFALSFARSLKIIPQDDASLKNVITFFLKNLTIIPFTIVWVCGLYRSLRS